MLAWRRKECVVLLKKTITFQIFRVHAKHRESATKVNCVAKDFALNHFDDFYGSTFSNWSSIRLALLCPNGHCAVVNSFSDFRHDVNFFFDLGAFAFQERCQQKFETSEMKLETQFKNSSLSLQDVREEPSREVFACDSKPAFVPAAKLKTRNDIIEEHDYSPYLNITADLDIPILKDECFKYPEFFNVYMFPRGRLKEFPSPTRDADGLLNYYLMDGASVLPVLALDVQNGDFVGDLCASPGGKSLAIIFNSKFGKIVCNDASPSRVRKLKTVLKSYLPYAQEWNKRILISNIDVCSWHLFEAFDKILLDVPCSNDRLSVTREGNSIFKQDRYHERISLPETQTDMLWKKQILLGSKDPLFRIAWSGGLPLSHRK